MQAALDAGDSVLLEIDLQGARQVRQSFPDAVLLFLAPPSWDELVRRLVGRGTEDAEERARRLKTAEIELASRDEFDATIVNADVSMAAREVVQRIVEAEAEAENEFNRETLRKLLADDLTGTQREQLGKVNELLRTQDDSKDPPALLLSLFLDTEDGSPRTSVGFGDIDTADQVTTLTHGIETDTANIPAWSESAIDLQKATTKQLADNGDDSSVATVFFLEWDSSDKSNVWNIEQADAGAERMAQTLRGIEQVNPDAQRDLAVHSLGTTLAAQMIADNPGLVQNAYMYGSAGVSESAAAKIEQQIASGALRVFATQASEDSIAPYGRPGVLSGHPVDPREIDGVEQFSSDGGFVAGFGPGRVSMVNALAGITRNTVRRSTTRSMSICTGRLRGLVSVFVFTDLRSAISI